MWNALFLERDNSFLANIISSSLLCLISYSFPPIIVKFQAVSCFLNHFAWHCAVILCLYFFYELGLALSFLFIALNCETPDQEEPHIPHSPGREDLLLSLRPRVFRTSWIPKIMVLNQKQFCPREHLAISGDILITTVWGEECYWFLENY